MIIVFCAHTHALSNLSRQKTEKKSQQTAHLLFFVCKSVALHLTI